MKTIEKPSGSSQKEEHAIVLEYLPNGYPLEGKMMPIAQAIGKTNLTLLELVPRRGISLNIGQEVYIGEGKRPEIYYIFGRLRREKLTEAAKNIENDNKTIPFPLWDELRKWIIEAEKL